MLKVTAVCRCVSGHHFGCVWLRCVCVHVDVCVVEVCVCTCGCGCACGVSLHALRYMLAFVLASGCQPPRCEPRRARAGSARPRGGGGGGE